eukprot:CAMPEP_0197620798 /NCGR_PEP_ID=MMETSP1338-20131121/1541_1 /TAXON_ID=43686 ORGANISM="Pelagodinium beii, Strain RCC1491" /NCGR_SAMPLE_ID=MMETSP1338 /ASSEMBLY_ACC=CAM_ASM_000754 /LENGTH=511 /DNA_ID=CAMNT_0043190077 /DNA_START=1336 /DNA_END=2871 /DNA_ORIENTATION=+
MAAEANGGISGGTYYQILGVAPDANSEDIKLQYRKLALKLHPDKNRDDPNATERFQELQEAYEVLSDEDRRAAYDQNSDFILRAFAEESGENDDGDGGSFLSVPSSRTFWCLLVEAVLADDGKTVMALAQQLEDEIWDELSRGGVCGFTLLHFAAFAGKPRSVQALIELGVNVNAKTQPLCVTPSQQFCRPTPLDLTIFVQNKKAREQTQRTLEAADACWGGVNMTTLDKLWQGLIKHQLTLIKDEVIKFTKKIPTNVRRVLRTEPQWRKIISFPGEDAASMEKKRFKKAMKMWRRKLTWVLVGDASMSSKDRLLVLLWNMFLVIASWWLFGFNVFELLQAFLVAGLLMCLSSIVRGISPEEAWNKLPSQQKVQSWLPPEREVQRCLQRGWDKLCWTIDLMDAALVQGHEELVKLHELGFNKYSEDARQRLALWWLARAQAETTPVTEEPVDDSDGSPGENKKKKSAAVANKIKGLMAEREMASAATSAGVHTATADDGPRRAQGRRRPKK